MADCCGGRCKAGAADGQAVEKVLEEVGKLRSFMVSQRKEAHGDYEALPKKERKRFFRCSLRSL